MKKLIFVCLFLTAIFASAPPAAEALDFTANGAIATITYIEPTKNADAAQTLLDDLAKSNVYFQLNGGAITKGPDVAASKPQGGGAVSTQVTLPIGQNQRATVTIWATATDTSGNESANSVSVTKTVDRLPPLPPQ